MHTSCAHHVFHFSTASFQLLLLLLLLLSDPVILFSDPVILVSHGQPAVVSQTCQFTTVLHQACVAAMMHCRIHNLKKILAK